jgi:hypothetical protein
MNELTVKRVGQHSISMPRTANCFTIGSKPPGRADEIADTLRRDQRVSQGNAPAERHPQRRDATQIQTISVAVNQAA